MVPKSKSKTRPKKKNGRPSPYIDPQQLHRLCAKQCTDEDLAACFGVSTKTIQRRKLDKHRLQVVEQIRDDKGAVLGESVFRGTFAEIMERGRALGRVSVRSSLFRLMNSKNGIAATIFLAKNLLGYRDVVPERPPSEEDAPVDIVWDTPQAPANDAT